MLFSRAGTNRAGWAGPPIVGLRPRGPERHPCVCWAKQAPAQSQRRIGGVLVGVLAWVAVGAPALAQSPGLCVGPEQRRLEIRDPSEMRRVRWPEVPAPQTVAADQPERASQPLTLDQAIRIALANAEVVRMLAGTGAVSSGRTIYDPAVSNTRIDQERSRFDPAFQWQHQWSQSDVPQGVFDPLDPTWAQITGTRTNLYDMALGLSKTMVSGGTASVNVRTDATNTNLPLAPLDPQTSTSADLSFSQPLLQGAGARTNLAPIVIAQIDTERSFFQTKDAVQELVRGVIEAYWSLVAARVEAWARQQQVLQGEEAKNRAEARQRHGFGNLAEAAQARASLANFRAALVGARSEVLAREAALRNLLGLPPPSAIELVPITPAMTDLFSPNWDELLRLAAERRPDLIELKLILEADEQRWIAANNQALPRLDAGGVYRWDGLTGKVPAGQWVTSDPGQFTGWQLGVTFSVPLGLRQARASLRQRELILMQDRANLEQGLHAAAHELAASLRNLAQYHDQYQAYREARQQARLNLAAQWAEYRVGGRAIYLDVLQAITDWGNAASAEVRALARYNTELANLERLTGTILETHGIRFVEERFCAIGPWGRMGPERAYPRDVYPGPNQPHYPEGTEPTERAFQRDAPSTRLPSGRPEDGAQAPGPSGLANPAPLGPERELVPPGPIVPQP